LSWRSQSKNATSEAFRPPPQSEGVRRVQSPEEMAVHDNLADPTHLLSQFFLVLFVLFEPRSGSVTLPVSAGA